MRKSILLLLIVLTIHSKMIAQDKFTEQEWRTTQYEMDMTDYDKDPDAEAVVIYSLGDYRFTEDTQYGLVLNMKFRKKIKILNQSGIEYANFEIPYYTQKDGQEDVIDISAITYNQVNRQLVKTELNNKQIFEEKIDDNYKVKKIALADVREGSVIEYTYTIKTPFYYNMKTWVFQDAIPTVHSKLSYHASPYYVYAYLAKNVTKFDENEQKDGPYEFRIFQKNYNEKIQDFGLFDVPAFRDNEFISSPKDYIMSMHFQIVEKLSRQGVSVSLTSTWQEIIKNLEDSDYFGKYVKSAKKEASKVVASMDLSSKSTEEKINLLTDYVKKNYTWNREYGKYTEEKLSDFLKIKHGNDANINLFLLALFQQAGLNADALILSTRSNGAIKVDQPFIQFFNYLIVAVKTDDDYVFIDATEPLLSNADLPTRCINVIGLTVNTKQKEETWFFTTQTERLNTKYHYSHTLDPEKCTVSTRANIQYRGINALNIRTIYNKKEDNIKNYFNKEYNIEVDSVNFKNYENNNMPVTIGLGFKSQLQCSANKIFVNPFCNMFDKTNPFNQKSRRLPIDVVYVTSDTYFSTLDIPDGYQIESLPENSVIDNKIMKLEYVVANNDSQTISTRCNIVMKTNIFEASDYTELKETISKAIDIQSQMVVLSKIEDKE